MTNYPGGVPRHDTVERHGTSEADTDKVLTPDGVGGVSWQTVGGDGVGHDRLHDIEAVADHETTVLDTALALRPDGAGGVEFVVVAHGELSGVGSADHHARYTDTEAEAVADAQIATHAADADAHHDAFVPADINTLAELNAIVTDATLDDNGDARTPTGGAGGVLSGTYPDPGFAVDMAEQSELDNHTADADAHHARQHDIDSAADHNGIIGVPIRMDDHGLTMGMGFEMDNGRLLGYNA